ncbi:MAG: hypothetical protein GY705_12925, partial [Bacteroidetes bacterium]|nr:hypothetical protein [Bacteroidota bacterium]
MEQDDEVSGEGNSYTTHFRAYDVRLGRWKSLDPVIIPWESPYASFFNNPNAYNDPRGDFPPIILGGPGLNIPVSQASNWMVHHPV